MSGPTYRGTIHRIGREYAGDDWAAYSVWRVGLVRGLPFRVALVQLASSFIACCGGVPLSDIQRELKNAVAAICTRNRPSLGDLDTPSSAQGNVPCARI